MGHGYLNAHQAERSHGVQRTYHSQTSSPQSSSSPASSPPSISPPGSSSSPISPPAAGSGQQQASTSTSGSSKQLVATFKLPKTCTSCGKAIKTQGKVCAKCKMRKYRERKKEQEHSLKVQMKTYREQEEALKARIRQLEEDLHRRGGSEITAPTSAPPRRSHSFANDSSPSSAHFVEIKPDVGALDIERYSSSAHHEKVLAQQQEVLKQQQEIISIQQSVIAQQQHVINQHNLGHLVPSASTPLLHLRRPFLDHSSAAAVAALAALADDTKPPTSRQASAAAMAFPPSQLQPSTSSSFVPHQRLLQRPSPQQLATLPPPVPELERTRRDATAPPASGNSSNRMAITHLLSPTTAEIPDSYLTIDQRPRRFVIRVEVLCGKQ